MMRSRGKRKREQDPARHGYRDLLDRASGEVSHPLDEKNRYSTDQLGEERPASSDESAAVAAAFGFGKLHEKEKRSSPLTKVESAVTDRTETTENTEESGFDSEADNDANRLMKSPEMQGLDTPELSGESAFGDDPDGEGMISDPGSPETAGRRAPNVVVRRPTEDMEGGV